jgi:LysM repeat protein
VRVVLHIGTDKTGSTSIQNTVFLNRKWLLAHSIYVPETGLGEGNGHAGLLRQMEDGALAQLAAELLAANGLSWKTLIFAGQQLNIPAFSNGTEPAEIGESITRHCVVAGDTLEAIARSYGVQPRAIMTANGLDRSSRLVVGQRLVIPDAHLRSSIPAQQSA